MQDGTYPSRNFATLGPSELQPPFTAAYIKCIHILFSPSSTGQVSDPIHNINILQSPVFLINSRSPRFYILFIKKSSLYPEVTELFCRVPLVLFTQRFCVSHT